MTRLPSKLYTQLQSLLPDLPQLKPLDKIDLTERGYTDVHVVVMDATAEGIHLVLSRYELYCGTVFANPGFEIFVNPSGRKAHVVSYQDKDFFHKTAAVPVGAGTISRTQANLFLNEFLQQLTA